MLGLTLSAFQYVSFAVSVVALVTLLAAGKTPDRLAAATLACLMFVTPFLPRELPIAVALASGLALVILVWLALRYDRWWLIGVAGFQLVVFSTHFVPLVMPQEQIWPDVTLRLLLWQGQIALCIFAIGESRWATYAKINPKARTR